MRRLRRETSRLKLQALNSLVLAIELFNRPHGMLRTEAVLFLLQHAFEMLIKAAVYQDRQRLHEPRSRTTYGFDKCLGIAQSDLGILTEDEARTLAILNGYRDCAMHYLLEMSEEGIYLQTQAAVNIFAEMLKKAFDERLTDYLPQRILPISTDPPREMQVFMDKEFSQIKDLVAPNRRRQVEAKARIRPYLIMDSALTGRCDQPSVAQVARAIARIKRGHDWQAIFPGVATLRLDSAGHGLTFSVKFVRQGDALPVRLISEGQEAGEAALVKEVNMLDRYSMGLHDLADTAGIGRNQCLALVHHLHLQEDSECFREFRRKSLRFKGYSQRALERVRQALPNVNLTQVWQEYLTARRQLPSS